jgi:hypothetical protein
MEIILAMVVASAVIFFGALISMGNERQRKAIDGLQEQIMLWALQDLKIKRNQLAKDVLVEDPLSWLDEVATRICGYDMNLKIVDVIDGLDAIVCISENNPDKIVFTSKHPSEISKLKNKKYNMLNSIYRDHQLLSLLPVKKAYKLSVLNAGILFDLELPLVWKKLTNKVFKGTDYLWMLIT